MDERNSEIQRNYGRDPGPADRWGRPRDPERIDGVLEVVARIWKRFPDLRLGQLIENATEGDSYYYEDEQLVRLLRDLYGDD